MAVDTPSYTTSELMISTGARELRDGMVVVAGLGIPQLAAALAQHTHAPRLHVLNEIGVIDAKLIELGVGNADARHWYRATTFSNFIDIVGMAIHRGVVDIGFLGALEVDQFGNNNASEVARPEGGVRRFGGGGGANDIATHAKATVFILRHDKRKLVERVQHNTSPGHLEGGDSRQRAGLRGAGPRRVLTDKCVFGVDPTTKRLALVSIHPGVSVEELRDNTGFHLDIPANLALTPEPTAEEVRLIREELDPHNMYTAAF